MIVANQQATKVAKPGEGPFHLPAFAIASQLPAIVERRFFAAFSMRHNQQDASFEQAPAQGIAVVTAFAITRKGMLRGLPRLWGTEIFWSVLSAKVTSAGLAEASWLPKGTPEPSTTTIHFVPLPRLVSPTPKPLFWPARNWRPENFLPNPRCRGHPVRIKKLLN